MICRRICVCFQFAKTWVTCRGFGGVWNYRRQAALCGANSLSWAHSSQLLGPLGWRLAKNLELGHFGFLMFSNSALLQLWHRLCVSNNLSWDQSSHCIVVSGLRKISQICTFEVVNVQTNVLFVNRWGKPCAPNWALELRKMFSKKKYKSPQLAHQLGQYKWYFAVEEKKTFLPSSSGWPCGGWTKSSAAENFVETGLLKRLISLKIGRLLGPALVGGILAISYRCMRLTIGCLKSSQIFGPNHCRQTEVVFCSQKCIFNNNSTRQEQQSKLELEEAEAV